jgi:hypothetical protein
MNSVARKPLYTEAGWYCPGRGTSRIIEVSTALKLTLYFAVLDVLVLIQSTR